MPELSAGDTAWMLTSAALVLFMIPGVAFFYAGMARAKGALNMIMMCFTAIATVSVVWVLYGFSFTYSEGPAGLIGGAEFIGLDGVLGDDVLEGTIPVSVDVGFQLMFAAITTALIAGAIAERAKFSAWIVFTVIWASIVYVPVAHWVWGPGGWIGDGLGVIDFAGGTAVHINSGAAALALALVLGRRKGWPRESMRPHNVPMAVLGATMLWFGWFGFNAGSAYAANNEAGVVLVNTQVAVACAIFGWLLVEKIRDGKPTTLGMASGVVAGLVAITPAANSMHPIGAMATGLIAGVLCALAIGLKAKLGYDDSFDVVGVHMVGGAVGATLIGLFAASVSPEGEAGLLTGGGAELLGLQVIAVLATAVFSFGVTFIIGKLIDATIGFRVSEEDEDTGVDVIAHAESGYDFSTLAGGGRGGGLASAAGSHSSASAQNTEGSKV